VRWARTQPGSRSTTSTGSSAGERQADEIWEHVGDTEARRVVEPLVSGLYYYAEVADLTPAGVQPVFSVRVDSDEHSFLSNGFVSHNTECRMAPLAMEMVRDIHPRHRRLRAELRRSDNPAGHPAGPLPEPAGQRLVRDRRWHGHEHPTAQPP